MRALPQLTDDRTAAIRNALAQLMVELRVACPGVVSAFDPDTQTVSVELALKERVRNAGVVQDMAVPPLVQVPVFMPRAGGWLLTVPPTAGDECLVVFADGCIDAWYQSGGVQSQLDARRHDLSDGFALIGVWSQPQKVQGYATDCAQLRTEDGSVAISIYDNKIVVAAPSGQVNVVAETANVSGSQDVNVTGGNVRIGPHTNIDGRDFLSHTHSGVQPGAGATGEVV